MQQLAENSTQMQKLSRTCFGNQRESQFEQIDGRIQAPPSALEDGQGNRSSSVRTVYLHPMLPGKREHLSQNAGNGYRFELKSARHDAVDDARDATRKS